MMKSLSHAIAITDTAEDFYKAALKGQIEYPFPRYRPSRVAVLAAENYEHLEA